jgi:hypothetical protein
MPFDALVFYLLSKWEHESLRDNYMADVARLALYAAIKEPQKIPRYWDLVQKTQPTGAAAFGRPLTVEEIIQKFKGG